MTTMPSFRRRSRGSVSNAVLAESANDPVPTTEEILLDLRDPLPAGRLEWGMPTRCPRCEDWGYIDALDLNVRAMQLHCPTCHFHWEITEEQIDAANRHADADAEDAAGDTPSAVADASADSRP
jgi:hypothetical protein